jgi:hypothetical protein
MIIADTGFWLALANRKDRHHLLAKSALDKINEPLITTWPVITESCHLLLHRLGTLAQLTFVKSLSSGAFQVYNIDESYAGRILKLMEKYRELPMDLADASLVILAEQLGHGRILSTDQRDFRAYKWKHHKPFLNLLLE